MFSCARSRLHTHNLIRKTRHLLFKTYPIQHLLYLDLVRTNHADGNGFALKASTTHLLQSRVDNLHCCDSWPFVIAAGKIILRLGACSGRPRPLCLQWLGHPDWKTAKYAPCWQPTPSAILLFFLAPYVPRPHRKGSMNRPGFRGACLVKVKPGFRTSRRAGRSSFPPPRPVEYTQWAPAAGGG